MAIKDIVLALAVRDGADPARDYALSMGDKFKAHVSAIAYALTPEIGFSIYPEFVSELAQQAQAEADKAVSEAAREIRRGRARRRR